MPFDLSTARFAFKSSACSIGRVRLPLLIVVLLACGSPAEETVEPVEVEPEGNTGDETEVETVRDQPRALGATATFADLVASARRLDDRSEGESEVGCVLRGSPEAMSWRFEADVATGVRPLPDAPTEIAPRLGSPKSIRILSRWGQRGEGALTLAAFTALPPPPHGREMAVLITSAGLFVASTDVPSTGPHQPEALQTLLGNAEDAVRLFVSAEAGTSLRRLHEIASLIPERFEGKTALAVVLGEDVQLPQTTRADTGAGMCPDGLPASEETSGDLDTARIVASLAPLREGAARCMLRASAEAARGGRIELAIRVAADGSVATACATADGLGDPNLRSCVLGAAGQVRFPEPGGVLDLMLPLRLEPERTSAQTLLCP